MDTLLKKSLLLLLLVSFGLYGKGQKGANRAFPHDSLDMLFVYLYETAKDTSLKKAVQEVRERYKEGNRTDSFAARLITVEDQLQTSIGEESWLNRRPFDSKRIVAFYEQIANYLECFPPQGENRYYAAALTNLGTIYGHFVNGAKAYAPLEKGFAIATKNGAAQPLLYAKSLDGMASVLWRKGEREKAAIIYQQALTITEAAVGKEHPAYCERLFDFADICRRLHKLDTAMQLFDEHIRLQKARLGAETARYALQLYLTGDKHLYLWQYKKALLFFQEAAAITKETLGEESLQYTYCLNGIGTVYYNTAEYPQAVPYYEKVLAIKERLFGEDYSDNALSLHQLATAYVRMGQYAKALPLFQRATEIVRKECGGKNECGYGYAFRINYEASTYQAMGQYAKALSLLRQAVALTKNSIGEASHYYAIGLNNLGMAYEKLGADDSALYYFKKAIAIRQSAPDYEHHVYVSAMNNLASLYTKTGDYDSALLLYKKALDIRKNRYGENHSDYAASLNSLGDLYRQMGNCDTATVLLQQALHIRKKILGEAHPDYAKNLNSLGFLSLASNNQSGAARFFARANHIMLQHIRQTYTCLSEQEKQILIQDQYNQFSYLPSLLIKKNSMEPVVLQQVYNNELLLKSMVLENQQQVLSSVRKSSDSTVLGIYEQWRFNKTILGRQALKPIQERSPRLDSIAEAKNHLEQQLSLRSAAFGLQQQMDAVTVKDIGQKLKRGEAAVEFLTFDYYNPNRTDSTLYATMIVRPGDTACTFVPLFEEKQLQRLLQPVAKGESWSIKKLYRGGRSTGNHSGSFTDSLYQLIWQPLEEYLNEAHTIYFAPVGLLHRVAFQALGTDSTQLLIDRYHLVRLLSTRSLALPAAEMPKPSLVSIWGAIQYGQLKKLQSKTYKKPLAEINTTASASGLTASKTGGSRGDEWLQLPGTRQEMDSLRNMFTGAGIGTAMMSDTSATEEAFKSLDGKSPPVLHIATHGFFLSGKAGYDMHTKKGGAAFSAQQDPMFRSGLVLSNGNHAWKGSATLPGTDDGILIAYEVAQLDLSNTSLVVLSACNTALGDVQGNEGVIGLQRAFKMAGVKQTIMSLWKVPDTETTGLMTLFYGNWLSGQSTHEALRNAQLKMKEKYPPYYWAAFIVVE